jgi:hypothetical protein
MNVLWREARLRLDGILPTRGYLRVEEDTYRKMFQATFGMVCLVEYDENVIPRLSVGLQALGMDKVVLSTDLHVLVSPDKLIWYAPGGNVQLEATKLEQDFVRLGLPWLERHTEINELTRALEAKLSPEVPRVPRRRWWQAAAKPGKAPRPPAPFTWKALSYCYEQQERWGDSLTAWRGYLGKEPSLEERARLAMLEGKANA